MASPQMQNLLNRYGVATEPALLQAIADELNEECWDPADGEDPFTAADAGLMLDGMLEAEYQRIAGGAYDAPDLDEEYELTGWNAEMAQAERDAEERAFWEGL